MPEELGAYVIALGVVSISVLAAFVAFINSDNPVISIAIAGIITLVSLLYAVEKVKSNNG